MGESKEGAPAKEVGAASQGSFWGAGRGRGLSTEAAQVALWRAADPTGLSLHLVSEIKLDVDDKASNMTFA